MSTHPTYIPKKGTQPWSIIKLLSAKTPLTSSQIAAELSIGSKLIVQALYVLGHRYGLVYQGKSMSGYLLTKKGLAVARRLGFSGAAKTSSDPASPSAPPSFESRPAKKRGAKRAAKDAQTSVADVVDDDLARVIREQQEKQNSKRKGMRIKRMGTQAPTLPVITGAGAGGAGGVSAFTKEHPDLVKERADCLARVAAIDAYAEACEKLRASSTSFGSPR